MSIDKHVGRLLWWVGLLIAVYAGSIANQSLGWPGMVVPFIVLCLGYAAGYLNG